MTSLALRAFDFANMLISQMGAEPPGDPGRFSLRRGAGGSSPAGPDWMAQVTRAAAASVEESRRSPKGGGSAATYVLLEKDAAGGQAIGLGEKGPALWQEPLGDFIRRIVAPAARVIGGSLPALRTACRRRLAAGERALREQSPEIADAVACMQPQGEVAALRLRCCEVGGVPHDVCMQLEPHIRTPRACVSVYRAVPETVLENSASEIFYFPPVQVEARVAFEGVDEGSFCVYPPRVRAPRGTYFTTSPYTGPLEPVLHVVWLNGRDPEAMFPMSEAGRKLIPAGTQPNECDFGSDMCLHGHEATVHDIAGRVRAALGRGERPDLFHDLCRPVLMIGVSGLSNGAQDNSNMPRAHLVAEDMPIMVPDRDSVRGELAERVFPFHRPGAGRDGDPLIEMLLGAGGGVIPF
jgi:hypothetical protein